MPYLFNFVSNILWSTLSKALDKSKNMSIAHYQRSSASVILSSNDIKARWVDFPFWNPNWYSYSNLLLVIKTIKRLYTSLSNNLEKTGSTETGLKFENTISSLDLNRGTTLAIFSSKGKIPEAKDMLHTCFRGIHIISFMCFTILYLIPSRPAALSLKEPIILHISFSVTGSWHYKIYNHCDVYVM